MQLHNLCRRCCGDVLQLLFPIFEGLVLLTLPVTC